MDRMPMTLVRFRTGTSISDAEGRDVSPIGMTSAGIVTGSARKISSAPCATMRRPMPLGSCALPATGISNRWPLRSVSTFRIGINPAQLSGIQIQRKHVPMKEIIR